MRQALNRWSIEYQPEAEDDSKEEHKEDDLLGELVAKEGSGGKVEEVGGKGKEGHSAQEVAPKW